MHLLNLITVALVLLFQFLFGVQLFVIWSKQITLSGLTCDHEFSLMETVLTGSSVA